MTERGQPAHVVLAAHVDFPRQIAVGGRRHHLHQRVDLLFELLLGGLLVGLQLRLSLLGALLLGDHLPCNHRPHVFAAGIADRRDIEIEDFVAEVDIRAVRQVPGIAQNAPLHFRVLVEDVNRLADDVLHPARQQVFEPAQGLH
jgi:hypothetical protein